MNRWFSHIQTLVKREGAESYLLYSLLSFAASVSLTRLFLDLTGYPQLGNSELHIAHVLWGGLLLFVASLLPLLLANRWIYTLGGILSGAGVGLFIDEVGKFITQSNDYFYPPAAPIIYAFFLLVVLLYLRVRRTVSEDPRAELYRAFDGLQEVLDHDLDPHERAILIARLQRVAEHTEHPNHAALAQALLTFVMADSLELAPRRLSTEEKVRQWIDAAVLHFLPRAWLRRLLAGGLLIMGLGALAELTILLPVSPGVQDIIALITRNGDSPQDNLTFLLVARLWLEGFVGVLLSVGGLLFVVRREQTGGLVAYFGLLISLTVVNLLVFYFDQFSAIVLAILQFGLLMGISLYRQHYLQPSAAEIAEIELLRQRAQARQPNRSKQS